MLRGYPGGPGRRIPHRGGFRRAGGIHQNVAVATMDDVREVAMALPGAQESPDTQNDGSAMAGGGRAVRVGAAAAPP